MRGRATADASAAMPDLIEPMLAGSGELPTGDGWAVEFAWEGLRVIAYARPNRVRLLTATGRNVSSTFPDLEGPLSALAPAGGVVLDGTVVALRKDGLPRRGALQSRSGTSRPSDALVRRVPVGFLTGDVLWCDGRSTLDLPYRRRLDLRAELAFDNDRVWSTPSFPAVELAPVMHAAEQHGLDALHAKQLDAPYRPGRRSRHLLRLPVRRVRQVVVGGWSPADPQRPDSIGALLLGVPDGPGLRYVGRAGLRSAEDRRAFATALPGLRRTRSPFTTPLPAEVTEHAGWITPQLVGRVEFADWLSDGRLRLPSWRGLVPDAQIDVSLLARPPDTPPPPPAATTPATLAAPAAAQQPVRGAAPAAAPVLGRHPDGRTTDRITEERRIEERRLEQHFVYNALNTIASVIRTDPARARELLLGFADLNRAADQPAGIRTTLGAELAVVRAYLELEQARFGKRLCVEIDVDEGLHELAVAPLALLDAVRTTVQERIEPRPGGGTLVLTAAPRTGECIVRDTADAPPIVVPIGGSS